MNVNTNVKSTQQIGVSGAKCSQCGNIYATGKDLIIHTLKRHIDQNILSKNGETLRFKCLMCNQFLFDDEVSYHCEETHFLKVVPLEAKVFPKIPTHARVRYEEEETKNELKESKC